MRYHLLAAEKDTIGVIITGMDEHGYARHTNYSRGARAVFISYLSA